MTLLFDHCDLIWWSDSLQHVPIHPSLVLERVVQESTTVSLWLTLFRTFPPFLFLFFPLQPPPSKVVHVRAVPDGCLNTEMRTAVQEFGALSHIKIMPDRRQALLEFEQIESAIACVNKSKVEDGIAVRERKSYFNFSKSQEINRGGSTMAPGPANRILLISIQNPLYVV